MAGDANGNMDTAWPVQLGANELSTLFASLGLSVSPLSPVVRLVNGESPSAGESSARRSAPAVVRALEVLAHPRQLLLMRTIAGGEEEVRGFLNDGEAVIRFDVGSAGCAFGEPCDHASFARILLSLAEVPELGCDERGVVVGRSMLEAVVALRLAGLFDLPDGRIDRGAAEQALNAASGEAADAFELIEALEDDGVLAADAFSVVARREWLDAHPYLTVPAPISIEAFELADMASDRPLARRLAVLGKKPERVVFLPAVSAEAVMEVLVELSPATSSSVADAVERLLELPLEPPVEPVAQLDEAVSRRFEGGSAAKSDDWSSHTMDRLAAFREGEGNVPTALLAPRATLEFLSWTPGSTEPHRSVIALDQTSAVEWKMDGSFVHWRPLAPGEIAARVRELTPAIDAPGGGAERGTLSAANFEALVSGDSEASWCSVCTRKGASGGPAECLVLLSCDSEGRTWSWRSSGDTFVARAVGPEEICAEVLGVLEPKDDEAAPGSGRVAAPRRDIGA